MKTMKIVKLSVTAALLLTASTAFAGRGGSLGAIQQAVDSGNAESITAEIERAEKLTCGGCGDVIGNLIDNPDYKIREVAAWWMAKRPLLRQEVRDQMFARLAGTDSVKMEHAADILGAFMHPDAMAPLGAALLRTDGVTPEAKVAIANALGFIGHPAARGALANAAKDANPAVRRAAIANIRELRGVTVSAEAVGALTDGDAKVRREAAMTVGKLKDAGGLAALLVALADPDATVRRETAWALGELGDRGAYAALASARDHDNDVQVRGLAGAALKNLR